MQKKRQLRPLLIAIAAACAAPAAWAIGWGKASHTAVLGQPLDFPVSLRLDPGDVVEPQCVSAEVTVGDARVPAPSVRVAVDTGNPEALAIRVLTSTVVEEPVVSVLVAIGCPARMSRRFTLLADPPNVTPMPVQVLAAVTPAPSSAPAPASANPSSVSAAVAAPAAPRASAPGRTGAAAPVRPQRITPADLEVAAPPRPRKERRAAAPAPAPAPAASTVAAAPVSRLRLDAAEPPPKPSAPPAAAVEDALQAVALAASAAREAATAASAAQERIASLERTVAELRSRQDGNSQVVGQLRSQLADAESAARWAKPVALAALALAALAGWLVWRLRALDVERQRAWRLAAEAQARAEQGAPPRPGTAVSQLPMVTTEIPQPPAPPAPVFVPSPQDTELDIPVASTDVLPVGSIASEHSPRDVTIEELLDLEQQAEFFVVLGQDDAAIDLLVHHLRDTGGGSPLPYLKLLEIYRRRGEREAYERTRARFNHRFNAYAPEWQADLLDGRSLEDYPGVLPRLQQTWPRPLDSMAELEALLFRKSRGELFELPAYREVLFLYQIARDLLDREHADSGHVDLLLPLSDEGRFGSTAPGRYVGMGEGDSGFGPPRATAPVDLDLSQPDTAPAIERPSRR